MGISGSKCNAPATSSPSSSSSSGAVVRRNWSTRSRLLRSSCLRNAFHNEDTQESDSPDEENGTTVCCPTESKTVSSPVSAEIYRKDIADQNDQTNCNTSDVELDEWGESSFTDSASGERSASRVRSTQPLNPPSRFLSRLSFYPGNLIFRLSRAKSLGSSNPYPTNSASVAISMDDEEQEDPSVSTVNRRIRSQGCEIFPTCFNNRPFRMRRGHCITNDLHFDPYGSDYCNNLQDNQRMNSRGDMVMSRGDARVDCTLNLFTPLNNSNMDGAGLRRANRRIAARERIERNIRFSRTLSVGRLRDRVLRRSLIPDLDLYRFQQDEVVRHSSLVTARHGFGDDAPGEVMPYGNGTSLPVSSSNALSNMSISFYGAQNQEIEIPRARDTGYHGIVEHRSNFIERRRRIRSQVRALQRLGSRLENLSGHDRSCILSGQHLGGRCTCRAAAREVSSNEEATARASISRIGMLAEALFEVLDEIHQQSVALSTRHATSSVASIPAPDEVVESLPLKIFSKLKRKPSDEAAQCYICLVEYEDGDSMRILPCHHEFHRACVDKWLKEIHRVCPLCRGDICRLDSLTT
ncbi:hypothetical protein F511_00523 [Dorcoceras hygrometricum]|uniref:RING-type domain-containing protein n=1 Tax=Dorcoceras hygrometricum TaxID=472368 RepID=A0A2Z7BE58_9LAMI|nr:hypothetical protein F511_00523 [Dorcoceras hygrometricum]